MCKIKCYKCIEENMRHILSAWVKEAFLQLPSTKHHSQRKLINRTSAKVLNVYSRKKSVCEDRERVATLVQKLWPGYLSLLSQTTQDYLSRSGTICSGLGHPSSSIHQDSASHSCPQTPLRGRIFVPLPCCVKWTTKIRPHSIFLKNDGGHTESSHN